MRGSNLPVPGGEGGGGAEPLAHVCAMAQDAGGGGDEESLRGRHHGVLAFASLLPGKVEQWPDRAEKKGKKGRKKFQKKKLRRDCGASYPLRISCLLQSLPYLRYFSKLFILSFISYRFSF